MFCGKKLISKAIFLEIGKIFLQTIIPLNKSLSLLHLDP